MFEDVIQYAMAIAPSVAAVASAIASCVAVFRRLRKTDAQVDASLKKALDGVMADNRELKLSLREAMAENAKLKAELRKESERRLRGQQ